MCHGKRCVDMEAYHLSRRCEDSQHKLNDKEGERRLAE
jgi:hypothetical protein